MYLHKIVTYRCIAKLHIPRQPHDLCVSRNMREINQPREGFTGARDWTHNQQDRKKATPIPSQPKR